MASAVTLLGSPSADPDEPLVQAARERIEAFGALYERYLPRIYRYLLARTGSAEDAADLAQAVFVKAMRGLPRYRSGGPPFAAWLFRIARNAATDAHRRRRHAAVLAELPDATLEPAADSPEEAYLRRERLLRLQAVLAKLEPDKRELLALRFAGQLRLREIAVVLGKREEAVKKQLYRTLTTIKEHYLAEQI